MSIRNKIILGVILIFSTCFALFVRWVVRDVKPRYLQAIEEPLVDTAHLLSSYLSLELKDGRIDTAGLEQVLKEAGQRRFEAKIYNITKERVDLRIYVADQKGIVIYDSNSNQTVGQDYSRWNDVRLSLMGKYGARSTKRVRDDPETGSLYVSAPVYRGEEIAGVVTVAKPVHKLLFYIYLIRTKLLIYAAITLAAIIVISTIVASKIVSPLRLLTRYARDIRDGRSPRLPPAQSGEVGELQQAFEEMRQTLEGKDYIERYVQTLTHELKSPLAAVRGAAELLKEDLPAEEKTRFLENILSESERIQLMVEKMLSLVAVERKGALGDTRQFDLAAAISEVIESMKAASSVRGITIAASGSGRAPMKGDPFLVRQAIANLVQNAVDFSEPDSKVDVVLTKDGRQNVITVKDSGPGIPEFAQDKVFDRFYSLARPGSGRKSTGLGLPFVREVAELHSGTIALRNRPEGGTEAILRLSV